MKAVSFTSGVVGSVDQTVERFVDVVRTVRRDYPEMPIGVEPYVSSRAHIEMLKDAGADEIKLNVETPRKDIFEKVCPDLDYDGIWRLLADAVDVFGRGRVISNIIYGMGESDSDLEDAMNRMCSMGVIPGLRALRTNGINSEQLTSAIGHPDPVTPERALRLAELQKDILEKHGMRTMTSVTTCMDCGRCDLVPFRDL